MRRLRHAIMAGWKSRLAFCVIVAVAMVGLRLALFDYNMFFTLGYIPNHDMSQGMAFFATDMHSMRLTGDIAWWGPQSLTGYAQYYQSFLSPLAPTPGNIFHILWSQLIHFLSLINIALPEYVQYLIMTYIILPLFAFFAFTLFASFLLRYRGSIILLALVYTLSGIGLWNSAWFYFQEPGTFFLVMAGFLAVLQRPTAPRLLFMLAAVLIQVAYFNYWTLYNLFFYVILVVAYLMVYPQRVLHLLRIILRFFRRRPVPAIGAAALTLFVSLLWLGLIAQITHEQSNVNMRLGSAVYTIQDAQDRVQELRSFTTALFEPVFQRVLNENPYIQPDRPNARFPMHDARYIGVFLIPFLIVFAIRKWRRVDRWLIVATIGVLVVCLAPPFMLSLWNAIPFMDRIQHVFYFYTQYWQLMIALLAARGFEVIFYDYLTDLQRQRFRNMVAGLGVIACLILLGALLASQNFPRNSLDLQSYLKFAVILLVTSLLIGQRLLLSRQRRFRIAPALILLLAVTDLSGYFVYASQVDHDYTRSRWDSAPYPLPANITAAFAQPWPKVDPKFGFQGHLFANMPIRNDFWPDDKFMIPVVMNRLTNGGLITQPDPISFYTPIHVLAARNPAVVVHDYDFLDEAHTLILDNAADAIVADPKAAPPATAFSYQWQEWSYNEFSWQTTIPADGWLSVHQLYDPGWVVTIDNQTVQAQQANIAWLAFPITAGTHVIRINYNPLSRQLYWIACTLLEMSLLILLIGAALVRRQSFRNYNARARSTQIEP